MRPVDPRLLRAFPEVRQILTGLGAVGIGQGLIAVGQALAVSHLVVAVVASLTSASTASTGSGMPSPSPSETASSSASGMPWGHLPLACSTGLGGPGLRPPGGAGKPWLSWEPRRAGHTSLC
ncbi:MAG: hypothetical protein IPL93_15525 [Actinomycetales bacterium]|nr:hypothetical protein [Actinomycetales bacterium]